MEHFSTAVKQGQEKGITTSGSNISYWLDSVAPIRFTPLTSDLKTDVAIIGGGLAGLSIAYNLVKAGKKVVVLEDGFIGSGESGRTTAHIVNALDDRYSEIERVLGEEKCRLAAESHTEAINFIERVSKEENIDCEFTRLDGFLFLHPTDDAKTIDQEFVATNKHGTTTGAVEQMHSYEEDGVYNIRLVTRREFCIYEKTVAVPVFEMFIPNVISPDQSGYNDVFTIRYGQLEGVTPQDYGFNVTLTIFNRWGRKVYYSDNYQYNWSGADLPSGTYYYEVTVDGHATCKSWLHLLK